MSVKRYVLALAVLLFSGLAQAVVIQYWQQANGARVYFVETHENPILDVRVDFDAGTRRDNRPGVADLTASLLDNGSVGRGEEEIRATLADLAVSIDGGADTERASLTLRTLSRPAVREPALALLADIIAKPTFPSVVLEREKRRAIDGLKQRESNPGFVADRAIGRRLYPEHPYGNEDRLSAQGIAAIQRQDLLAFWHTHYQPRYAVVSIVGDIGRPGAERLAERLLTGLRNEGPALVAIPAVPPVTPGVVRQTNSASQAHIRLGMPLISRSDPDYYALMVGNYVLGGGGFDARLVKELRVKRGLTYRVSSQLLPMEQAGPFTIALSTRKDQADQALQVVHSTLARFIDEGPTEVELAQAKANIIGGFPLRFDSNRKLLGLLSMIGAYRLPLDYLERYPRDVAALTADQVRDAWRRRVSPNALSTVVIGATATP
ncbi:pitrilysin family protein [Crenobacter sp. SG2305]|uniref:M16 family metallopeptidase n=1 Tax=Crenobacter oryzisoli TaxID=3056844 RepID=UPI0025AA7FC5|nr:pitrilysin family protein [Crenobacter sp. SG2305]MDN0083018.1 pitrilysin family protein [Crenobacter sp. SG2305]